MCVVQLLAFTSCVIALGIVVQREPETERASYLGWFIRALGTNFLWRLTFSMAGSLVILIGAGQALRFRSLTIARVAAALACVPLFTPLLVAGLPFGVWLLVVLLQRETAAEFHRLAAARSAIATKGRLN
jgi:hypothetical protein